MTAELIARLESADGPCRELDAAIARSIGWGCVVRDPEAQNKYVCWRKHYRSGEWIMLPHYTASLDAALTLVPEGCGFKIKTGADELPQFIKQSDMPVLGRVFFLSRDIDTVSVANTPALALAAAALKARGV